jgi:hypothetical protein
MYRSDHHHHHHPTTHIPYMRPLKSDRLSVLGKAAPKPRPDSILCAIAINEVKTTRDITIFEDNEHMI